MGESRTPGYLAFIPSRVRYDPELRPNAKLLYAEISALANAAGYCWAKNEYFSKLYNLTQKTISELIGTLARRGHIVVEVLRDPENNEVTERRIWIDRPVTIEDTPIPKNRDTPPPKNRDKNSINNINNNPPKVPQGGRARREAKKTADWKSERFEKFWKYYPRGESKQSAINAWDKLKPSDELIGLMAVSLTRQMATEEWKRGIGIPYASTWLNQRRWEDAPKTPAATTKTDGSWAEDEEVINWLTR